MRVIVVGAGPGGGSAALVLARAGADVTLFEKSPWPREKTCGDGISPLAVAEGERLGLRFRGAVTLPQALVSTPRGTAFRGGWPGATPWGTIIERRSFDAAIVDAAIAAGADFHPKTAVSGVEGDGDGVVATVRGHGGARSVGADAVIVADGATGTVNPTLGLPSYRSRLVALRGYSDTPAPLAGEYGLFYERGLSPGYGWVFPVDERRANAGICIDERVLARGGGDMRTVLTRWVRTSPFARERLGDAPHFEALRGGIIPSGRKRRHAGRMLTVGDAAGVADPFTAEGIYHAVHSGRLAAEALAAHGPNGAGPAYERALRIFDRNERAARGLRATFNASIEPYARHAARSARYAGTLNTSAFFLKRSFIGTIWDLTAGW